MSPPETGETLAREVVYHVAPGVRWAVETWGLLLTDGRGQVCPVTYPEAAIWDLMSRGYHHAKVLDMLSWIAALDVEAVRELLAKTLETWTSAGFLLREEVRHG